MKVAAYTVMGALAVLLTVTAFLLLSALTVASAANAETLRPMPRPEVVNFDGCDGKLVPGTNYYNLVDPRCKTVSSQYASSPSEDTRRELAAKIKAD